MNRLSRKSIVLAGGAVAGAAAFVLLLGPFDVRYGLAVLGVLGAVLALYVVRAVRRIGRRTAQAVRDLKAVQALVRQHETHLEGTVAALTNLVGQDRFELISALEAQVKAVEAVSGQLSQLEQKTVKDAQRLAKSLSRFEERTARKIQATEQRIQESEKEGFAEIEALLDLRGMFEPRAAMLPTRGWSAAPTTLLRLVQTVLNRKPALVVACGAGASSLWIGYALEKLGSGRCIVLEHDPGSVQSTREALERHGLSSVVEVRAAPLRPLEIAGDSYRWYDLVAVDELGDAGLVFVDGPTGPTGRALPRFPAVPVLKSRLDKRGALVVLADTDSLLDEQAAQRWCDEFGATVLQQSRVEPGSGAVRLSLQ